LQQIFILTVFPSSSLIHAFLLYISSGNIHSVCSASDNKSLSPRFVSIHHYLSAIRHDSSLLFNLVCLHNLQRPS
jgi:hypothetical protein